MTNSKRSQNTLFNSVRGKMSSKMASVGRFLGRRFPDRVNRTFVIQIILIVAVAGIILLAERFSNDDSWITRDELGNKAALFIDFNNTQRMFTGEVVGGMTILDALNASTAAGKIENEAYEGKLDFARATTLLSNLEAHIERLRLRAAEL